SRKLRGRNWCEDRQEVRMVSKARKARTLEDAMSLANQVVVITGASSGIGWSLARVLAARGCKVGLLARRQEQLVQLAKEIEQAGGQCAHAAADVGDRPATLSAIQDLRT